MAGTAPEFEREFDEDRHESSSGAFVGIAPTARLPRSCIIGAGCSGFTTAKALQDRGLDFDWFEISDRIGGNWAYRNPNGMSACYQSLHIDTSKYRMQFEDYPIPDDFPDFPHHSQVLQYFNDYVDHFGLRERISFNTAVRRCSRDAQGVWHVERLHTDPETQVVTQRTDCYDALFVCNGHHWSPRWPTPAYPGTFEGVQIHSHEYLTPFEPHDFRDRNVLVVGMGNSAMDISSELSQRPIAKRLFVSARRGAWILPKYINGQVADKNALPAWMPDGFKRWLTKRVILKSVGRMEDYGLPAPDHDPLEAHPTVSGEFLTRVGCGDIHMKPAIERLDGDVVEFSDGSREPIDAIIWATGYNVSFPFLEDIELPLHDNHIPLFKRALRPEYPNLFFIGLAQPLPTLVNLGEQQARWLGEYLLGEYHLPDAATMERVIERDERRFLGNYYDSPRHRMQVDFGVYCADLIRERQAGAKRAARAGNELPIARRT